MADDTDLIKSLVLLHYIREHRPDDLLHLHLQYYRLEKE